MHVVVSNQLRNTIEWKPQVWQCSSSNLSVVCRHFCDFLFLLNTIALTDI